MFRYLCPAAISKTHSCPHFLMKPQKIIINFIPVFKTRSFYLIFHSLYYINKLVFLDTLYIA